MGLELILSLFKIFIVVSIFFVWVVRYQNIIKEFSEYKLPNWFRDFMGIIKLSACVMIVSGEPILTLIATSILGILMFAAFGTHIKAKHALIQMVPSFSLMCSSIFIGINTLPLL